MTKRPVGLTKNLVALSMSLAGITLSMIRLRTASTICFCFTSGPCCVETTMADARTGTSSSYSMVTWVLPSGRSQSTFLLLRTSASFFASLWA